MPRVVPGYKEEAKSRIISVAQEAFSEGGYDQTTMEDIGHRLGVSKGALYLYFKNKEELFRAIVEKAQLDLHETLRSSFAEGNLLQGANTFLNAAVNPKNKANLYLTFEFISEASRHAALRELLKTDHERDLQTITVFLQNQRERRLIRDDVDIDALAIGLIALYNGLRVGLIIGMKKSDIKKAWMESIRAMVCPLDSTGERKAFPKAEFEET